MVNKSMPAVNRDPIEAADSTGGFREVPTVYKGKRISFIFILHTYFLPTSHSNCSSQVDSTVRIDTHSGNTSALNAEKCCDFSNVTGIQNTFLPSLFGHVFHALFFGFQTLAERVTQKWLSSWIALQFNWYSFYLTLAQVFSSIRSMRQC